LIIAFSNYNQTILRPHFERLRSTPSFYRTLDLSTQAFWFGIFNNFCDYFLFHIDHK
jgi:hypothetical protein